jgi:hypothetical protein
MTRFADLDTTYLDVAVQRVKAMLTIASDPGDSGLRRPAVLDYVDPKVKPPFWWIFLDQTQQNDQAEDVNVQVWPLALRYVIGLVTEGYDGTLQRSVFKVLPRVTSYFQAHKRLVYQDYEEDDVTPMESPKYLDAANVRIEVASALGAFRNTNQVGIELRLRLPFTIHITEEY